MNILIAGCGKVGARLAYMLAKAGHDVSVVDESEKKLARLGEDFPGIVTLGLPIDQDALKSAGIESCDAMAILCEEDNVNIMVAQIAKEIFGVKRVLCRIYDAQLESVYTRLGLESFCPTSLSAAFAKEYLVENVKPKSLSIGTHSLRFYEIPAPKQVVNCAVSMVDVEEGHFIFALHRADGSIEVCAGQNLTIRKGDILVIGTVVD